MKERLVLSLIAEARLSERKLAEAAGVSRGTVRSRKAGYRVHDQDQATDPSPRCPKCRAALIEVPCRACQLREELGLAD